MATPFRRCPKKIQGTVEATKGIKLEIGGIQSSTAETVSDIRRMGDVIGEVDDFVSSIAASVEDQATTTTSIAENAMQASAGMADVNANVVQSCASSVDIASVIAEVNRIAWMLADSSAQVSTSAGDLNGLAEDLKIMIGEFKVERLMAKAGYADLDQRRRLHEKMVGQVLDFTSRFESGSATVTMDLMTFLSDWQINLIKGVDCRYAPVLNAKR